MTTRWPEVPLGEVAEVRLGRQRSPKDHDGPNMVPYIRAANVGWGGLLLDDVKSMNFEPSEVARYRLEPGDILIVEGSGSAREVGKPAIWNGDLQDCCFQNTLLRVRPREHDVPFLFQFFRTQAESGAFAGRSRGVGIHHIGREALASMLVPLPPLEEQRRIAEVLDRADALRAQRRATLALLDTLTQSIFLDMFGDPATNWLRVPVVEMIASKQGAIRTGPFGSQLLHAEFTNEGIPVLGIDNAVGNEFRWVEQRFISPAKYEALKRYTVFPGDVLITIMGTCGRVSIAPHDLPVSISTKHLCCITLEPSTCSAEYFRAAFLLHPEVLRQLGVSARGAVMPGLNTGIIKGLRIPLPPIKLQREFAERVAAVGSLKDQQSAALAELDELFASLQQRAFRGDL